MTAAHLAVMQEHRARFAAKRCRVCSRPHGAHADSDYDRDGECTRETQPVLTAEQAVNALKLIEDLKQSILETAKPGPDGSLLPLLSASNDCGVLDNVRRLLERELKAVAS
jgi:hypothetical protein